MATNPSITRISDLIGADMTENPATPVPFERFAPLKDNPDMLVRAAFWCFYAAWQVDHTDQHARVAVEARNDGHQLRAITRHMALTDCVLIRQTDLDLLQQPHAPYLVTYGALFSGMLISFIAGVTIVMCMWRLGMLIW